jgi:hypothetical protein
MLTVTTDRRYRDCDGTTRRDFLRVGGLGAMGLGGLMQARSAVAAASGQSASQTSVVWLWLGGGPTHVETFDPKMTAPVEYRSVTGEVKTRIPGVSLGGNFQQMAQVADKMAFVRSFNHGNSGHGGGTHWVMTGYNNRGIDNGGLPSRPSIGSIASKSRGPNHRDTGMPTYVRIGGIGSDGPAFLGTPYAPFGSSGDARNNMNLQTGVERLEDRRGLLSGLDRLRRTSDRSGVVEGLNAFEQQAFNLVLGKAPRAFDLKQEDPRTVAKYGSGLGSSLLMARRLCEAGCGFVTMSYGGWDMHSNIVGAMNGRGPVVDRAVSAFVDDVSQRGLSDRILLVITGEFGRTPKINRNKGRDHWAPLSTLALSGGGLRMGQAVGESDDKAYRPKTDPVTPQDLMATVFHVLGIDPQIQFTDPGGRPVSMIDDGVAIASLV